VNAVLKTHSPESPTGLDVAGGPEDKFPNTMFEEVMRPAIEAGVPITVHAGEQAKGPDFKEAPPSFIRDAIERLGARRIGHGLSLMAGDEALWDLIREKNICIECCPPSNAILGYVPMGKHPLKYFLDTGVKATLNTDDPLMFDVDSVRSIFVKHGRDLGLTPEDVIKMASNGIDAAFVSEFKRELLREKLKRRLR
jgi:adenosine deaminase